VFYLAKLISAAFKSLSFKRELSRLSFPPQLCKTFKLRISSFAEAQMFHHHRAPSPKKFTNVANQGVDSYNNLALDCQTVTAQQRVAAGIS
jgi:hypothetical protein